MWASVRRRDGLVAHIITHQLLTLLTGLCRLCDPYITWPILVSMFGEELASEVACKYLVEVSNHRYKLRPQYAT